MLGQVVPLAVGLVAIPTLTRYLGEARFGLLALMWTIIGYFSLLDLGLGRATTKFVAEALGAGDAPHARRVAGFTAAGQTALGVLGGLVLAAAGPWLVAHLLRVPAGLRGEAEHAFRWLALSIPFVVLSLNLRAALEWWTSPRSGGEGDQIRPGSLFQCLSATKDALHQGRPQCLTIETHTGLVISLAIFLGRQNVADPFVRQPANGEPTTYDKGIAA